MIAITFFEGYNSLKAKMPPITQDQLHLEFNSLRVSSHLVGSSFGGDPQITYDPSIVNASPPLSNHLHIFPKDIASDPSIYVDSLDKAFQYIVGSTSNLT